jgi:HD-GYP domain-containing protein (c-di-GMP phosphodiesterase class II)
VPLESDGRLLGVLSVTDPISSKPFEAEECHLLLHLADRVATAWQRALDMEQSRVGVEDTATVLREVVRHLERGRRSAPDRVRLACALARELGLAESEAGVISFAASIHDIGMHKLSEHLTEGPGSLSSEDRAAVNRHPEFGADLLGPLESVGVVREVILSHHEWWDGTGYPRGLKNTEIPIGGRILSVVDAYESMTVGRPHRTTLSRQEAIDELFRLKGRQFDPDIVDVFEAALREVEKQMGVSEQSETQTANARR